jgi:hypothetical protein
MKTLLSLLLMAVLLAGCVKPQTNNPFKAEEYLPGQNGSYWIYQMYVSDSLGNFTAQGPTDSAAVVNMQGYVSDTRKVIWRIPSFSTGEYVANGANLYDPDGNLIMADPATTGIIEKDTISMNTDPDFIWESRMVRDLPVTVPAGSFVSHQYRKQITWSRYFIPGAENYIGYNFVKGVGLVSIRTFYYNQPNLLVEYRLVRYNIVN